ncbi:MAG: cyclic dehypoxanthinyl futalosine synthase [Candidatus Omnitrophota bacterium]|nr:cyclic dehypoxanthinyl futalosine synthase [Candidatus Omnitrophota bacterium]
MNIHERILNKRLDGTRLTLEDGILLYSCDLLRLGSAAQELTRRLNPEGRVTFIVDRNISYTNACVVDCDFCAFYRSPGHAEAYTLSHEEVLAKVQELVDLGGTQVLIQGGVNPELPLDYYLDLIRVIRQRFPSVHVHSFSVVEFDMIAKKNRMPLAEVFRRFKEAGLNSVPGGGAEILVERVRKAISPKKATSDRWLEVMRTAHEVGLKSTATMVVGHVETIEERVMHLVKIREVQDQTQGFRAFIPWTLSPKGTPRMNHLKQTGGEDYLKTVAVARLMLDNIDHIQSGWLTEGLKVGQIALAFGCDDMGGTLLEDKVLEPTGIEVKTRREDLIRLIREAGHLPAQRDTNYDILHVFN